MLLATDQRTKRSGNDILMSKIIRHVLKQGMLIDTAGSLTNQPSGYRKWQNKLPNCAQCHHQATQQRKLPRQRKLHFRNADRLENDFNSVTQRLNSCSRSIDGQLWRPGSDKCETVVKPHPFICGTMTF